MNTRIEEKLAREFCGCKRNSNLIPDLTNRERKKGRNPLKEQQDTNLCLIEQNNPVPGPSSLSLGFFFLDQRVSILHAAGPSICFHGFLKLKKVFFIRELIFLIINYIKFSALMKFFFNYVYLRV